MVAMAPKIAPQYSSNSPTDHSAARKLQGADSLNKQWIIMIGSKNMARANNAECALCFFIYSNNFTFILQSKFIYRLWYWSPLLGVSLFGSSSYHNDFHVPTFQR